MFYAITYDISDSKKDHAEFFEKIKALGAWMHYIDDTWIVSTKEHSTADEIFAQLEPLIDKEEDYIFVAQIDPDDTQGWLPDKAWAWFKRHND